MARRRRYVPSREQIAAAVREETAAILAAEAIAEAQRSAREELAEPIEMPWVPAGRFAREILDGTIKPHGDH